MIGFLFLVWGIGIVLLAFKVQTSIQESTEPEWQQARELYKASPFIFYVTNAIALTLWPVMLAYLLYKMFVAKGKTHGN